MTKDDSWTFRNPEKIASGVVFVAKAQSFPTPRRPPLVLTRLSTAADELKLDQQDIRLHESQLDHHQTQSIQLQQSLDRLKARYAAPPIDPNVAKP